MHISLLWTLKAFYLYRVGQMLEVENIYDSLGTIYLRQHSYITKDSGQQLFPEGFGDWASTLTWGTFSFYLTIYYYTIQARILYHNILHKDWTCSMLFLRCDTIKFQSDYSYDPYGCHRNVGTLHICLIYLFMGFVNWSM